MGLKALRAGVAQGAGDLNPAQQLLHKVRMLLYVSKDYADLFMVQKSIGCRHCCRSYQKLHNDRTDALLMEQQA